ncbi:MAG: hypothetical protein ACNA7J_06680, partial [Wenzhouxiangella sp.]
ILGECLQAAPAQHGYRLNDCRQAAHYGLLSLDCYSLGPEVLMTGQPGRYMIKTSSPINQKQHR